MMHFEYIGVGTWFAQWPAKQAVAEGDYASGYSLSGPPEDGATEFTLYHYPSGSDDRHRAVGRERFPTLGAAAADAGITLESVTVEEKGVISRIEDTVPEDLHGGPAGT